MTPPPQDDAQDAQGAQDVPKPSGHSTAKTPGHTGKAQEDTIDPQKGPSTAQLYAGKEKPKPASDNDAFLIGEGTVLDGRYRLVRELGRGGFAVVFEAVHIDLNRVIALKLMRRLYAEDTFYERFFQEARSAGSLDHPCIIRILDSGRDRDIGLPYMAMELLEGDTLRDHIEANGPLAMPRAMVLFARCLRGLGKAHNENIIHKDLKPSNLFLTQRKGREELVVLDFGAARVGEKRFTQTGVFCGTAQYAAPEYLLDNHEVTPALDVYQMGLILCEALSGHPVVPRNLPTFKCLLQHRSEQEHELPRDLEEGPLGKVLRKSICKNPAERFNNAEEFAEALEEAWLHTRRATKPMESLEIQSKNASGSSPSKKSTAKASTPDPPTAETRVVAFSPDEDATSTKTSHSAQSNAGLVIGILVAVTLIGLGVWFFLLPLLSS